MKILIKLCASIALISFLFRQICPISLIHSAQSFCFNQIPNSPYRELYQAIVCGAPIQSSYYRQIFINTGLIHILVVSGSHLIFLEKFLFFKSIKTQWKWALILLPFSLMVGFQAPIARALVLRTLYFPILQRKIKLAELQNQALTTALCFLIFPGWVHSLSFLLSWTCAILLAMPKLTKWPNEFENSLKIFVGLIPFAGFIGIGSPISILANWLIAPFIGGILFPAAMLSVLFHPLALYIDSIWTVLIQFLSRFSQTSPTFVSAFSTDWIWVYPLILHSVLLNLEVKWKRISLF